MVSGYTIVKDFSMSGSSQPSLLIIYGPIISTDKLSYGVASTTLEGKLPYFKICFLFLWKVMKISIWVRMSSLMLDQQ